MNEKTLSLEDEFKGSALTAQLVERLQAERERILQVIWSRFCHLQRIIQLKTARDIPISDRESECLKRLDHLLRESDVKQKCADKMSKIISAIESGDRMSLCDVQLIPREPLGPASSDELNLESLLTDYLQEKQQSHHRENIEGVRLEDIIAAVEAENGALNAAKRPKKTARGKVGTKRNSHAPPRRSKKPPMPRPLPGVMLQSSRGFFNVLRVILLAMPGESGGLSTDEIVDIVHAWSSNPRVRRSNSSWIDLCSDWCAVVRPALTHLSGKTPTCNVNYVDFDDTSGLWHWTEVERDEDDDEDEEETEVDEVDALARLFSAWSRTNDFPRDADDEGDDAEGEQVAETKPVAAKSRRRNQKTERVPPPYFPTDWKCQLSTPEQRRAFQEQEIERYSRPWSTFVYNQHGYPAVVGPILRETANGGGGGANRTRAPLSARDHPLLKFHRPPWVSISEIVRDAVARLPNGEGTRPDIAMLVQDSSFLVPSFSQKQLNQCISSALDRLQGEGVNSPVMYDSSQRLWIYRFRHLSPKDFARIYKEQSAIQRERFSQIYAQGVTSAGNSRNSGGRSGHQPLGRRKQPYPPSPEEFDDRDIPDIEDLARQEAEMMEEGSEYFEDEEEEEQSGYYNEVSAPSTGRGEDEDFLEEDMDDEEEREVEFEPPRSNSMAYSQPRRMNLEYRHQQQQRPPHFRRL